MLANTTDAMIYTAIASAGLIAIRQAVLSFFSAKSQIMTATANDNVIARLQSEIQRLELIIIAQNKRIEELDKRLEEVIIHEIEDSEDISELSFAFEGLCAGQCKNSHFSKIKEIIDRLKQRRKLRRQGV